MRALGYIRVPTADHATSGREVAAQREAIAEACRQRGWELADTVVDSGLGVRGDERPGLKDALGRLADGSADAEALVVTTLDRVVRSFPDYAGLVLRAKAEGWQLVALDVPDEALQASAAVCAQLERQLISGRTVEALSAARARGVRLGRPVQVSAELEGRIVALHRRRQLTARAIARLLEAEGVPSPRGGPRWHHGTVADIVRRHGGRLTPGRPRKAGTRRAH